MTVHLPDTTFVPPERMWLVNTGMGGFETTPRAPGDSSAFAHWFAAGRLFLRPWAGRLNEFDNQLAKMTSGDLVFAYENDVGVVAIGRVRQPKDLTVGQGGTDLFPKSATIVKSLAVDWDTSVTRNLLQVSSVTKVGGSPLQSCGRDTAFYSIAVEMLREAHRERKDDPDAREAAALARIRANPAISPVLRDQQIQARVGQGAFRKAVLAREPACRLTGTTHASCLVASHIKPWAVCDEGEHLDSANGLMLAPHVDHLFDTGRISFEDDGWLIVAPGFDRAILRAWHIDENGNASPFAYDQARYLLYHRDRVLGQPRPRRQRNLVGDVASSALAFDAAI